MSKLTLQQQQQAALERFNGLLDILENFTKADANTHIETGDSEIPSLRKWLAEQRSDVALAAFLGANGEPGDALRIGELGHGARTLAEVNDIDLLQQQCLVNFANSVVIHLPLASNNYAVQLRLDPVEQEVTVRFCAGGKWSAFKSLLTQVNTLVDSNGLLRIA